MEKIKSKALLIYLLLLLLVLLAIPLAAGFGAVQITFPEIQSALFKGLTANKDLSLHEGIFLQIRLPRVLLCLFVGASLAVSGALLQALFRNPIIEPGLIGTSSGAALGASVYFVLGASLPFHLGEWTLPVLAFAGGVFATLVVMLFAQSENRSKNQVLLLLLIGISINALCISMMGFLSYIARDLQARSITFWSLGTFSGANWKAVLIVGFSTLASVFMSLFYAKKLNTLILGDEEAMYLGVSIKRLKIIVLGINVLMVATATAFVGVISFVGLIVPHVLRLLHNSENTYLIIAGAMAGGLLVLMADFVARNLFAPAELPIGIVCSFIGAPLFIYLLKSSNKFL
ncbi:MAG: iron ABC transporter permease [Bacteroidetes bacterium]|nr:iron ABC transporter permease [Bacteroidota bacterium]